MQNQRQRGPQYREHSCRSEHRERTHMDPAANHLLQDHKIIKQRKLHSIKPEEFYLLRGDKQANMCAGNW